VTRADLERRLHRSQWPEPPVDLRARVLAAASVVDHRVTWSDRVWFSQLWRVAGVAAAAAAIAIHSWPDAAGSIRFEPTPQAMAEAQVIADASRDIGLPPSLAQALAHRTLLAAARGAAADQRRITLQALVAEGEMK
jgi:hypothetical protein